jgi:hypothetical protein
MLSFIKKMSGHLLLIERTYSMAKRRNTKEMALAFKMMPPRRVAEAKPHVHLVETRTRFSLEDRIK